MSASVPDLKYLREANEAYNSEKFHLAQELYKEVLCIHPNNIEALLKLSHLYMLNEDHVSAVPLLINAIKIAPTNPHSLFNLGLAYQKNDEIYLAIENYNLAIKINPKFSLAYNNLGIAYQHLGDLEQANICFKKAITIDRQFFDAYFNFSQTHKFNEDDLEIINFLETCLSNNQFSDSNRVKIHFTLGKAYDDIKNYQFAFSHYKKGNEIKDHGFDIDRFSRYIDKIIYTFDKNLVSKIQTSSPDINKKFVFIIGMPRSGSTLIEQIITTHPQARSAGETGFIGEIVDNLSELLDSPLIYPDCMKDVDIDALEVIASNIYGLLKSQSEDIEIVTDKSPINFLHIGLILTLFPRSIVIHSKRNPLATCLSCYFQNFEKQHQYAYSLKTLGQFYKQYERILTYWKSLFGEHIIEVIYEELIENQELQSKKLIEGCNLEWNKDCLEFYNSTNVVQTASKWQTRQPIYSTSIEKHMHYIDYIEDLITELNQ